MKKTAQKPLVAPRAERPKPTTSPWARRGRSPIHGRGLYARCDIPEGTRIIEYVGERITKAEAQRRDERRLARLAAGKADACVYLFEINKRHDIDGDVGWNTARLINHACEPNCRSEKIRGRIWILANREIAAGEELFYDYGFDFDQWREHRCLCGAASCVGHIVAKRHRKRVKRILKAERATERRAGRKAGVGDVGASGEEGGEVVGGKWEGGESGVAGGGVGGDEVAGRNEVGGEGLGRGLAEGGGGAAGSRETQGGEAAEVRKLKVRLLESPGWTVAAAESLTAGRVQRWLAGPPGASGYFRGGVTAYGLDLKTTLLGVEAVEVAAMNGVSEQVAVAMARGVVDRLGATLGVATTGYAEVESGKGVRVPFAWLAVAWREEDGWGEETRRVILPEGDRAAAQDEAAAAAVRLLVEVVERRRG